MTASMPTTDASTPFFTQPGNPALVADRLLDIRRFLHPIVEDHGQRFADVGVGELVEAVARIAGQDEGCVRPPIFVHRWLGIAEVVAGHHR